ncbi:hypothetical protein SUNI508_06751 [Seiridium unicorne]|uniref:Uncharacterized protein n=1 Tax=Seiridium unicorne TaxID=138068 RepID=A0ABR2UZ75_9PEZI
MASVAVTRAPTAIQIATRHARRKMATTAAMAKMPATATAATVITTATPIDNAFIPTAWVALGLPGGHSRIIIRMCVVLNLWSQSVIATGANLVSETSLPGSSCQPAARQLATSDPQVKEVLAFNTIDDHIFRNEHYQRSPSDPGDQHA